MFVEAMLEEKKRQREREIERRKTEIMMWGAL
jgi:hypothetical protein